MKSKKTRERILDASLELFNEKKASNVSTVQISAAMKISPGNLYYYYANKEDVIRCIWEERMANVLDELLKITENIKSAADLFDFLENCIRYMIEYRFFYTELSTLFINDEELVKTYHDADVNMRNAFAALVTRLGDEGKFIDGEDALKVIAVQNAVAAAKQMLDRYDLYLAEGFSEEEFVGFCDIRVASVLEAISTDVMKEDMETELSSRGYTKEKYLELIR